MVEADNLTDRYYKQIEKIERRRTLLTAIVAVCFVLAPIALGINAHFIISISHTKGDMPDANIVVIGTIFMISAILIAIGIKKYMVVKDLKNKLSQMQLLEDTIYSEVLKSNMHQLE